MDLPINENNQNNDGIVINFNYSIARENGIFDNLNDSIMYIIVNDDVEMEPIKITKHCCNIVSKVIRDNESSVPKSETYLSWLNNFEQKSILKAPEENLLYFINNFSDKNNKIWCDYVIDIDNKDTSPFSITAVAFTPMLVKDTPKLINYLKGI
ncbi:peptidyl-tRNA hydrolase PTH2 [Fadolivirus algeromassiliense]|jgi:peptidyl-tRNA hydrolase|uniref:peptidyl-tRNA hydrolase n=1 Tax=Fadolivirus FV1/VV64 TaxID=3070911 RepID=A0A7D3QXE8_9VIRU|nr:peptidyl-tRNA hydrolase PTH2 [Fadolivirus algeromassiliense]QKF94420.1 peptidyl-tRNA hydrolase PTH2 [Fadolivirus FV1/VV64]